MTAARRLTPEWQLAKDDQEWRKPAKANPMERAALAAAIVGSAMMLAAESAAVGEGLGGHRGRSRGSWKLSLRPWNRIRRPWTADLAEAV
jgi:hypothetical protein